jgi:hypothetical protein
VASQAAQATGIGQNVLQQMLPAIAAMLMGGLFKQSTNQLQAGGFGASNPLGEIIEQMMRQGGGMAGGGNQPSGQQAQPQGTHDPFDNPFGKVLKDMFGGGAAAPSQRQPAPDVATDNPFGKILRDMMGGGQPDPRTAPDPQPSPSPRANPSGRPKNPYDDIFGDMFETGRKTRDDYQKGMESVFERFLKGMDNPRQS